MKTLFFAVIAYLIGSIPTALIIGLKFYNTDIRKFGSNNLGGTNAGRVLGKTAGLLVSVLDILKVFLPALLIRYYLGKDAAIITGVAGMLGHCYPIFAQFKGGKAVSSFFGIVLAVDFGIAVIMLISWVILKYLTNYVSVASILTGVIAGGLFFYNYGPVISSFVLTAAAAFVIYKHKANILRLINGTENKVRNKL